VTRAPAVSVEPAADAGAGAIDASHDGAAAAADVVDVLAADDEAVADPLVAPPTADPATHAAEQGWAVVGVVVAEVGGGVVGAGVAGEVVGAVGATAGGAVLVTVVPVPAGAGVVVGEDGVVAVVAAEASDVDVDPAATVSAGAVAVDVVTDMSAALVPVVVPTAAIAEHARQRLASTTRTALNARAISYLNLTVRVTVRRCPAPSSAAKRRISVPAVLAPSRPPKRSLIRLCGCVICDSVS
jgi:hypothetical protein